MCWVLVQLTKFGPPATQLLPPRGRLSLSVLYAMFRADHQRDVTRGQKSSHLECQKSQL